MNSSVVLGRFYVSFQHQSSELLLQTGRDHHLAEDAHKSIDAHSPHLPLSLSLFPLFVLRL